MNPLEILADAVKIVENIQGYSREQKKLWQRIPSLALEADGRTGFSDAYSMAYHKGFWALNAGIEEDGCYSICVDLATGELVQAYSALSDFCQCNSEKPKKSKLIPARRADILTLAFSLDELDAPEIINRLKEKAKKPYCSCYDSKKQAEWRDGLRKELNLKEIFVR